MDAQSQMYTDIEESAWEDGLPSDDEVFVDLSSPFETAEDEPSKRKVLDKEMSLVILDR